VVDVVVDLVVNFDGDGDVNLAGERRRLHEQHGYGTADTSGLLSFQRETSRLPSSSAMRHTHGACICCRGDVDQDALRLSVSVRASGHVQVAVAVKVHVKVHVHVQVNEEIVRVFDPSGASRKQLVDRDHDPLSNRGAHLGAAGWGRLGSSRPPRHSVMIRKSANSPV
jgi:hypothetical protein